MTTFYNETRISEYAWAENGTTVTVLRRSHPSGAGVVAITFAYDSPDLGAATSLTIELGLKDAHWLAGHLIRAAEIDPPRRDLDPDEPPF